MSSIHKSSIHNHGVRKLVSLTLISIELFNFHVNFKELSLLRSIGKALSVGTYCGVQWNFTFASIVHVDFGV